MPGAQPESLTRFLLPRRSLPAPCTLPATGPLGFSPRTSFFSRCDCPPGRRPGPGSRQGQGQNFVSQLEDRTFGG